MRRVYRTPHPIAVRRPIDNAPASLPYLSEQRSSMTPDEARETVIEGIDYAAYRETDSSLHDADKNRLFGCEHFCSGRPVYKPSPWADGDFEGKMAQLLVCANVLNHSVPEFNEAQRILEKEESLIGRVIRRAQAERTD
jgi:hypothetical protein